MSITVSFILSTLEIIQLSISQRMHKELLYAYSTYDAAIPLIDIFPQKNEIMSTK